MIAFIVSPKSFTGVTRETTAKKGSQRGFGLKAGKLKSSDIATKIL